MDKERCIQGYLECDGFISKISSINDIKAFVKKVTVSQNELTEEFLDRLTAFDGDVEIDDCSVAYLKALPILKKAQDGFLCSSYKIREGTVAIADEAFCFDNGQIYDGYKKYRKREFLSKLSISETAYSFGSSAFAHNYALSQINLPKNLLKIGETAFLDCVSLIDVDLPLGLLHIGRAAFQNSGITMMKIPFSVKSIGSHAFSHCKNLTSVVFMGCPETLGSAIFDYSPIEKVFIPKGEKTFFQKALFELDEKIFYEM